MNFGNRCSGNTLRVFQFIPDVLWARAAGERQEQEIKMMNMSFDGRDNEHTLQRHPATHVGDL